MLMKSNGSVWSFCCWNCGRKSYVELVFGGISHFERAVLWSLRLVHARMPTCIAFVVIVTLTHASARLHCSVCAHIESIIVASGHVSIRSSITTCAVTASDRCAVRARALKQCNYINEDNRIMKTINIYFFYLTRRATGFHHLEQLFAHGIHNQINCYRFSNERNIACCKLPQSLFSNMNVGFISFLFFRSELPFRKHSFITSDQTWFTDSNQWIT